MSIHNALDISTAHVQDSDMELLRCEKSFTAAPYEYGFIIMVPPTPDKGEKEHFEHYSEDFKKVINMARLNDCKTIVLDCDGEIILNSYLSINEW